jgi:hypothetical protein
LVGIKLVGIKQIWANFKEKGLLFKNFRMDDVPLVRYSPSAATRATS